MLAQAPTPTASKALDRQSDTVPKIAVDASALDSTIVVISLENECAGSADELTILEPHFSEGRTIVVASIEGNAVILGLPGHDGRFSRIKRCGNGGSMAKVAKASFKIIFARMAIAKS